MTITVDSVVSAYMKFRSEKDAVEAQTKARLVEIKEKMLKLEAWLKARADADGVSSFKTPHGTAFMTSTDYAVVSDWDAVLEFVRTNEAYDLLEKRVSKAAARGYIDSTGAVPPGIDYGTKVGVNVRRPSKT